MELSDKKGIQHIVLSLAQLGLKEVVICPGSRDAPLIISFNRHPNFNCISIRDERSAAFIALGRAVELNEPVALLCTSGSAPLNFAPAISEAYYQRIPLIVLTADRPKAWTDQGDGQTINQTGVFRNYIRKSFELNGDASSKSDLWEIDRSICEAYNTAMLTNRGPVHINITVDEPLYNYTQNIEDNVRVFREEKPLQYLSDGMLKHFSESISQHQKIMILVGQNQQDTLLESQLKHLSQRGNVIVLTESTSNIHHEDFIENIDRCITGLSQNEMKSLMPEVLITLGGAIVSKRIKKALREHAPIEHWNIHLFDSMMDHLSVSDTKRTNGSCDFLQQISKHTIQNTKSDFKAKWLELHQNRKQSHQAFSERCGYSDFKVFDILYNNLPANTHLHLSNSSPIRYAQLFDNSKLASTYCNRGVSGIDGCTSTSIGIASVAPDKEFILITGDIAFHYDKNAFWNELNSENIKIIIINNDGGGIFKIIPGPNQVKEGELFQVTPMHTNAQKIAEHYQWEYFTADSTESIEHVLKEFLSDKGKRGILEIFTDAESNPKVLEEYWKFLNE
ncbi:MAG: 2-succinyl-5-enolpyruvyl-6-hydroxy-3-cyclohexene-1-carboxylic-acid synthase [Chitinophagales bacterium]|nr:2-succinyl-5-enolpyruvyl-6-hydroxy-3-cyclohexene-1-carboxylic-acid synthase [Chitinophagales bacterium]